MMYTFKLKGSKSNTPFDRCFDTTFALEDKSYESIHCTLYDVLHYFVMCERESARYPDEQYADLKKLFSLAVDELVYPINFSKKISNNESEVFDLIVK